MAYVKQAITVKPSFSEALLLIARYNAGIDRKAAAEYAKKAYESRKNDIELQRAYAEMLSAYDIEAGTKVFRQFIAMHASPASAT
jgi:hypothetical protein